MKVPPVGWAFFGLAVVILIGYVLNRGLYVGSTIVETTLEIQRPNGKVSEPYYKKYCSYLYMNGIRSIWVDSSLDRDEAENAFCPPLRISN